MPADVLIWSEWRIFSPGSPYMQNIAVPYDYIDSRSGVDEYINHPAKIKIAISSGGWFGSFPNSDGKFIRDINKIAEHSKLVIITEVDIIHESLMYDQIQGNVVLLLPGIVHKVSSEKQKFNGGWLARSSSNYKSLSNVLATLTPYQPKPKMFDILLGQERSHRTIIYNLVNSNSLNNQVIMTYPSKGLDFIFESSAKTDINHNVKGIDTTQAVDYNGLRINVSEVIPLDIYNQTAYTIVAETLASNGYSFFTEKIAKPIIARRLFVVFSGQHYLRYLRELGFKTFNGIIDESYDSIENDEQRFIQAVEQVKQLCAQNQTEILEKIKEITEHNFNHLMNIEHWAYDPRTYIPKMVEQLLKEEI